MLPPIDDSILQSNPKFAAVYAALTKNVLNPNGSTKHHHAQKEREAITEASKTARIRAAKSHLLRTALSNLDLSPPASTTSTNTSKTKPQSKAPLPTELLELILLLSSRLTSPPLSLQEATLLENTPQWLSLHRNLPKIASLLSAHLQTQALGLARIHSPSTNASYLHRSIPKLVSSITASKLEIAAKKRGLEQRRLEIVSKTTTLLGIYHLATVLIIQILEQNKHGSMARHIKTKTEYLSLSAQQIALEAKEKKVRGERMVYTDEVKGALGSYMDNLRSGRERLSERKREAERVLWGYGVGRQEEDGGAAGKEKMMREIARVYGELVKEVGEVGRDVERLKGG